MADPVTNPQVLKAKTLKIHIDREERKNEPNLTLGHLLKLTNSIVDSFGASDKRVNFPNIYSLQLLWGDNQDLKAQGKPFPFELKHLKNQSNNDTEVRGKLFPDDIVSILRSIRSWVNAEYGKKGRAAISWGPGMEGIISRISQYVRQNDLQSYQDIAMGELQTAAKKTRDEIQILHQRIIGETQIKTDDVQPIITEIENKFRTASEATEYEEIWEDLGKELAQKLADHDRKLKIVEALNKKFSIHDARKIINAFYEQIINQYNKKESEIESPWNKVSQDIRKKINPQKKHIFTTNQVNEENVIQNDNKEAKEFIYFIEELLEEIKKEPKEETAAAREEADDDGGGEAQSPDEQLDYLTSAEITKKSIDSLIMRSGEIFFKYFTKTPFDPNNLEQNQRDWLLKELPEKIRGLIDEDQIKEKVFDWIAAKITPANEEGDRYSINAAQFKILNELLAKQFFTEHIDVFSELIQSVASAADLDKKQEPVEPDTPAAETVVPDVDTKKPAAETQAEKDFDIKRGKEIAALTEQFLAIKFGDDKEFSQEIHQLVYRQIETGYDPNQSKFELFYRLQLNQQIFEKAQTHYAKKLKDLNIDGNSLSNVYTIVYTLVNVHQNPQDYLKNLTDSALLTHFGLENSGINAQEFRNLLTGLLSVSLYLQSNNVHPWRNSDDDTEKVIKDLGGVKSFLQAYGRDDGSAALNNDQDEINNLNIDDERKQKIQELYRVVWIKTIAERPPEELTALFLFYGVDPLEIDFQKPEKMAIPDGFIFSQMNQVANGNFNPNNATSAQNDLVDRGKAALGSAGLKLIAPEVALALEALSKIPIIGDMAKDIEEKAGNLILVTVGAGLAGLASLLRGGAGALVGGVAGGILGSFLGPWGAVGGATLGAILGGGGAKTIGSWFKGLGGQVGAGSGLNVGQVAHPGLGGGFGNNILATAGKTFKIAGGTVVGGTVVTIMVSSGSQLHPVAGLPDPGYQVPGEEIHCSQDKTPLDKEKFDLASGAIAIRGAEIVSDLYQGFWCYWNRSPGDYPEDVTDYPASYPELFDEVRFSKNPDESYTSLSSCSDCLFWCTWLTLKSFLETGTPITISLNSQGQADAFRKENRYVEPEEATVDNVPPGSTVYFYVEGGPNRLNHTALVIDVDQDGITFVQSNSSTKWGSITFNGVGPGVVEKIPGARVGGFGTP